MDRSIKDSIAAFENHFSKVIDRIATVELHLEDRMFRKVLFVSILDALSRSIANPDDRNRVRVTKLIARFGDWPEHDRVSAPQLKILLDHLPSSEFDEARELVSSAIESNSSGRLVPLSDDPDFESRNKVWPVECKKRVWRNTNLEAMTHLNLFYEFRCTLVHEFREPGYGMEFTDDGEAPYYHGMTTVDDEHNPNDHRLELVYPLGFYTRTARLVLGNLVTHFDKQSIDPYSMYNFGSSWLSLPSK